MSATAGAPSSPVRTYGGWRRPASPGIGPLRLIPTITVLVSLAVLVLVAMIAGFLPAVVLALLLSLVGTPAVLPWQGRTLYARWGQRWSWRRHRRARRNVYRSGIAGVTRDGARTLPGLLAPVQVWTAQDAIGRVYGLVEIPQAKQWAVVLRVAAQTGSLVDLDTRNVWVASWGEYLAQLGQEGGVAQAAAVVETAPDPGQSLAAHVSGLVRDGVPAFAARVQYAAAAEFPTGVAETLGYVSLTYDEHNLGVTRGRGGVEAAAHAVAEEIGRRLPGLSFGLKAAGVSTGAPLTPADLARRVHEAYDPACAVELAAADAAGVPIQLDWSDAGPTAHEEGDRDYRHDSGRSRTWEAIKPPPGVVRDNLLERLMSPTAQASRKRVTLLYRPIDAANTATVVDRDLRAAINREGRRRGIAHAHDTADLRAAKQATDEEADGAGVVGFSILVTATVPDDAGFDAACTAVERDARSARIRLSPVYGAQSAAFAAALGVGLSLPDLSVVPHPLREHL